MPRYICQCGGVIDARKPPTHCPHCGAKIGRVRQTGYYAPLLIIALLFAALLAFAVWLVRRA
jgi:hypothetical protein